MKLSLAKQIEVLIWNCRKLLAEPDRYSPEQLSLTQTQLVEADEALSEIIATAEPEPIPSGHQIASRFCCAMARADRQGRDANAQLLYILGHS
jgi:hypothetical protein